MTLSEMDAQAQNILRTNDKGNYTVPTAGLYPYQWNWDSAFAALGFAQFDIDRAWTELETLLSGQWDNGMVPHILFHSEDPGSLNRCCGGISGLWTGDWIKALFVLHTLGKPGVIMHPTGMVPWPVSTRLVWVNTHGVTRRMSIALCARPNTTTTVMYG